MKATCRICHPKTPTNKCHYNLYASEALFWKKKRSLAIQKYFKEEISSIKGEEKKHQTILILPVHLTNWKHLPKHITNKVLSNT